MTKIKVSFRTIVSYENLTIQKFDPYINVDPGTMSPYQHGEVFVTDDGVDSISPTVPPISVITISVSVDLPTL